MKSNTTNQHTSPVTSDNDAFNIDPITLGRPLNIAKNNLTPKISRAEKALTVTLNAMTKRNDCRVRLCHLGLEMRTTEVSYQAPVHFTHERHGGDCMLEVSPALLTRLADAFYGGTPCFNTPAQESEGLLLLNASEQRVQARLAKVILQQLDTSWRENTHTAPLSSCCLNAHFELTVGEVVGKLSLQMDDELLIALGQASNTVELDPQELADRRHKQLCKIPVQLNAVLAQQTMSLEQVTQLKVGDIITSDIQEIVEVSAGAQKLYRARVSEQNNHLVLQITDHLNPAENF